MKKFIAKIVGIATAFAMIVGIGVAIINNKPATPVYATPTTASVAFGNSSGQISLTSSTTAITDSESNSWAFTAKKANNVTLTNFSNGSGYAQAGNSSNKPEMISFVWTVSQQWRITSLSIKLGGSGAGCSGTVAFSVGGTSVNAASNSYSGTSQTTITNSAVNTVAEDGDAVSIVVNNSTSGSAVKFYTMSVTYETVSNTPSLQFSEDSISGEEGEEFSFTWAENNLTNAISWSPATDATDIINYTVDVPNKTVTGTLLNAGSVTLTGTSGDVSDSVEFTVIAHDTNRLFTVTSTNAVSGSGDTITGASASYSQTYGTAKQATAGNSMTLSITGLTKKVTINKLVLSMHSNNTAGAGSISVTIDDEDPDFIAGNSSSSGLGFDTFGDNDAYGNAFRNVTWDGLDYTASSSIEIKIYCITTNSLYCESYNIFFSEQENTDVVTALSVSPSTWSGYDSATLDVSDFTVTCTSNVPGVSYNFLGIGHMEAETFVPRIANFSSGRPDVDDTRLCWKAKYPTEAGGSTYLYAYVTLTVSADSVSSVELSGTMSKTSYSTAEAWSSDGLTATAVFASTSESDVTDSATYEYYRDEALTDEVATPNDLGVGINQTVYVKAIFSGISNLDGYAQIVSINRIIKITFIPGTDVGATQESLSKDGVTFSTAASESTFLRDDNYRIYSGKQVTISSTTGNIVKIRFTFTSANNNRLTGSGYVADDKYGTWTGDSASFNLTSSGDQSRITKMTVLLAPTNPSSENGVNTRSTLSYNYTKDGDDPYEYSDVKVRLGGFISKAAWDTLDTGSHIIQGYGLMLSNPNTLDGIKIKELYDAEKEYANNNIASAITRLQDNDGVTNYYTALSESHHNPALVQKDAEDYYLWNLCLNLSEEKFTTNYTAVAYIRTSNGVVFFNEVTASVKSLAQALIDDAGNGLNGDSYGGSLGDLAGK